MHKLTETTAELSFGESKAEIKLLIGCFFSIQLLFHLFSLAYIQVISSLPATLHLDVLSPKLLSSFTTDAWLIVFLVSFSVIGYAILTKVKDFPLYLLAVYPVILLLLSFARNVSSLQIFILLLFSCAVVLSFAYQKIKQLEYSQI